MLALLAQRAGDGRRAGVVPDHGEDADRAQPVERSEETGAEISRMRLGMAGGQGSGDDALGQVAGLRDRALCPAHSARQPLRLMRMADAGSPFRCFHRNGNGVAARQHRRAFRSRKG